MTAKTAGYTTALRLGDRLAVDRESPDPNEKMPFEGELGYIRRYGDNLWLFVAIQVQVRALLLTIPPYPFQEGSSLNAAEIKYQTLKAAQALKPLHEIESVGSPHN